MIRRDRRPTQDAVTSTLRFHGAPGLTMTEIVQMTGMKRSKLHLALRALALTGQVVRSRGVQSNRTGLRYWYRCAA